MLRARTRSYWVFVTGRRWGRARFAPRRSLGAFCCPKAQSIPRATTTHAVALARPLASLRLLLGCRRLLALLVRRRRLVASNTYKVGVSLLTNSKLSEALRLSSISSESCSMSLGIPRHRSPGAPLGFDRVCRAEVQQLHRLWGRTACPSQRGCRGAAITHPPLECHA